MLKRAAPQTINNREMIMAFALTEPEAGSNPLGLQTSFREDGSDYVLNGTKYLITNSGIANAIIVFARRSGGDRRIGAFTNRC